MNKYTFYVLASLFSVNAFGMEEPSYAYGSDEHVGMRMGQKAKDEIYADEDNPETLFRNAVLSRLSPETRGECGRWIENTFFHHHNRAAFDCYKLGEFFANTGMPDLTPELLKKINKEDDPHAKALTYRSIGEKKIEKYSPRRDEQRVAYMSALIVRDSTALALKDVKEKYSFPLGQIGFSGHFVFKSRIKELPPHVKEDIKAFEGFMREKEALMQEILETDPHHKSIQKVHEIMREDYQ